MPDLKIHRGTILYCTARYQSGAGPGQESVISVFANGIGGIRANELLTEADQPSPFETVNPEMAGATVYEVVLSISNPNGSFLQRSHHFGDIVLIAWSEPRILGAQPHIDPDWRNNPAYIAVHANGSAAMLQSQA